MKRSFLVPAAYAVTLCLSSFLLFLAQPIQGKMLLPLLGGTPSVWNACMLFFQGVLLLSYLYAHLVTNKLSLKGQMILHALVLLVPFLFLPQDLPKTMSASAWLTGAPLAWLLSALAVSIGPGFFAVATTSPLLQRWYLHTDEEGGRNPYPLYAAGNIGSLAALLGYPLFVEPSLTLGRQTWTWTVAYGLLVLMIGAAGWTALKSGPKGKAMGKKGPETDEPEPSGTTSRWTYVHWILLSALPSSLMLGVTSFLTTDIASIPMLWVLPLALYTLSFVMAFSRYTDRSDRMMAWILPFIVGPVLFLILAEVRRHLWLVVALHLLSFFVVAVACHGRLNLLKPAPRRLTSFYFCLALGGVCGGIFNTLVAPLLFTRIIEYPLALIAAIVLCRPRSLAGTFAPPLRSAVLAAVSAAMGITSVWAMTRLYSGDWLDDLTNSFVGDMSYSDVRSIALYGIPTLVALAFVATRKPLAWTAAFVSMGLMALGVDDFEADVVHRSRSFFGTLTVNYHDEFKEHALVHGGILHGEQRMGSPEERAEPRSYYHRDGPLGQIVQVVDQMVEEPRIGVIGLGTGAVAAYGHRGNRLTFFELDPSVERLARDPKLFTYVSDCLERACNLNVVIGDGRLKLAESKEHFDLIVVDAFSSDAIPMHLLTIEAMETYLSKLTSAGIVAFHISNRYVNLEPVLLNLAMELDLGYALREDEDDLPAGKGASTWVILARDEGLFDKIAMEDDRWTGLEERDGVGVWRDDYANVLRVFTWY